MIPVDVVVEKVRRSWKFKVWRWLWIGGTEVSRWAGRKMSGMLKQADWQINRDCYDIGKDGN
jgi:hypothetical protein